MGLGFLVPGGIRFGGNAVGCICSSTRPTTVMRASEGDEPKDGKRRDWDTEWQKFRESKEQEGPEPGSDVPSMKLPGEPNDGRNLGRQRMDDRVESLTNRWSNDSAFLLAIGGVFLLGLFYVRVYQTGGISH
mmetsp:Transcript_29777/g.114332  ORF Transcript_29777/g.114332 Transcript_29777/m.114332 type:complete len:132 (+) Transcript_29777:4166-4561(+)|eukprot:CAMPEP_0113964930 /NCGR_PEP_ID=MMETSP0011_2-20120614/7451_1 /TAXON_ID=101924 /ORGANISM="Rhodosorus marinus" /LENGTH=131 /DNA_ID=CAMNT_0000977363 /DNA_START=291 /DNA_END=686 /DNA_ORIENTATION=+ /assembly_acc=CAM_ASM_000156